MNLSKKNGVKNLAILFDLIIEWGYYLLFFSLPLIFSPLTSELFEFNKIVFVYILTILIVTSHLVKAVFGSNLKDVLKKRTILTIPILIFLFSQALSTYFSIDRHTSLFGYYSRFNGGLLSSVSFALLYFVFVSNFTPKKVFNSLVFLLVSAVLVSIWAILEHFGIFLSCLFLKGNIEVSCWVQDVKNRVFATLGQPNWLAAWIAALSPLAWSTAISKSKKQISNIYIKNREFGIGMALSALFFTVLLFTKSRSGLLGFGVAYLFFWAIGLIRDRARLFRPFLIFNFSFLILAAALGTPWTPNLSEILNQQSTINYQQLTTGPVLEAGGTESGEIRKIVWRGAIDIWKKYPFFGSGVETFAYAYPASRPKEHNLTSEWNFTYNKAHNEYLNFLATTGIFGLAAYLTLIGFSIIQICQFTIYNLQFTKKHKIANFKIENSLEIGKWKLVNSALLAGYMSLLVSNFFGFSTVSTSLLFFLFPAMSLAINNQQSTSIVKNKPLKFTSIFLLSILLLVTSYLLLKTVRYWLADFYYSKAIARSEDGDYQTASLFIQKASRISPDEPVYWDKNSQIFSELAIERNQSGKEKEAGTLAEDAREKSDIAISLSPYNLNILKTRVGIFINLSQIDPSFLADATYHLQKARELSPTDAKISLNLGVLLYQLGATESGVNEIKEAIELKPDYFDARRALISVFESEKKYEEALAELEIVSKLAPGDQDVKDKLEKLKRLVK